jgi:hypothetical protein
LRAILILTAVLMGALAVPSLAAAAGPPTQADCELAETSTFSKQFWEERCSIDKATEVKEAAERAKEAAERVANEPKPLASLRLVITNHHGHTYANPGHTDVRLVTTLVPPSSPEGEEKTVLYETLSGTYLRADRWFACQKLDEYGEGSCQNAEGKDVEATGVREISWSCQERTDKFPLIATARSSVGGTLETTGVFHEELTRKWCNAARKRERLAHRRAVEQVEREIREEARQKSEEARRNRESYERELAAWESNCRAVGGHVVHLKVGITGATAPFCYGPNGNPINVPS